MFPQRTNRRSFPSLHNITSVNYVTLCAYFLPFSLSTARLTQTGIRRFFATGNGSRPVATSDSGRSGRGAANCSSQAADNSSALASIKESINCIRGFRKFATRFIRLSLNSAVCPLFIVSRYWMTRRCLSSAVSGFTLAPSNVSNAQDNGADSGQHWYLGTEKVR